MKAELEGILSSVRQQFKDKRICFSHTKFRYEIEIPEEHVKGNRKPSDFEFTSARKGYERFLTPSLKALVEKLEIAEDRLKEALSPFLTAMFRKFHD